MLKAGAPHASALQIHNAILKGANPELFTDESGRFDRGKQILDVAHSLNLLKHHHVDNDFPLFPPHTSSVAQNLHDLGINAG